MQKKSEAVLLMPEIIHMLGQSRGSFRHFLTMFGKSLGVLIKRIMTNYLI